MNDRFTNEKNFIKLKNMGNENPTTVRLNETAKKIKEKQTPYWGLKNILSAGLLLFDRLSVSEQKKAIADVNLLPSEDEIAMKFFKKGDSEFKHKILQILKDSQEIPIKKKRGRKASP